MKKSYIKILVIELLMISFCIINSFIINKLFIYKTVIFLLLSICAFKVLFEFEKDKHINSKDTIIDIFINLIIIFIIYYILGIATGYTYSTKYYSIYGLKTFIIPILLTVIIKEFLRYQLLQKSKGNLKLILCTLILFIMIDISDTIFISNLSNGYDIIKFIGLTLFPAISNNILSTYLSAKTGYKPSMIFNLIMGLYKYLIPIVPDLNEYLQSIFLLIVPAIVFAVLHKKIKRDDTIKNKYTKKINVLIGTVEIIITVTLVYLVSGYFKYYAVAISSGSMEPTFSRGSVVIIEKIKADYSKLKVGDIIAYKYENKILAHRLVKINDVEDEKIFYTKGDYNKDIDNYEITQNMVLGKINYYIPFIGYPTIWLSEL